MTEIQDIQNEKKSNSSSIQELKAVLIMGNDIYVTEEIRKFYNQKNYLLIGDSQNGTTLEEIDKKLNNNVNSDTIITVYAHGHFSENHHKIHLSHTCKINSSDLFQTIQKHSQDPLQIDLKSCYSGNSINEIHSLKEDSILITNSKSDNISQAEIFSMTDYIKMKQCNISNNPYVNFLESIHLYAIQHGRFITSEDIFEINPSSEILLNRDKTKEFLEQEANRFIKFSSNKLWKGEKVNLSLPKFSDKDIIIFSVNFLTYFYGTSEKKLFNEFIKENIKSNENILDLISNPDYENYRSITSLTQYIEIYEVVKLLIEQGIDVNKSKSASSVTPLILAVQLGNNAIVDLLIEHGADVNQANGYTPLYVAAEKGHYEIAKLLIEKGADIYAVVDIFRINAQKGWGDFLSDGSTALFAAARNKHYEITKLLIEKGADVDKVDSNGHTPLYHAIRKNNNSKVIELLIEKGADVNKVMDYGTLPFGFLTEIARIGNYEIAKLLIEKGADVNAFNYNRETPLFAAAEKGHYNIVNLLIEKGADVNAVGLKDKSSLFAALENEHYEIAKLLIEKGASVDAVTYFGAPPLYAAAEVGNYEIVKFLIEKGANVDAVYNYGDTPLFAAAEKGRYEIVKLLIEKGADVNKIGYYARTPLYAVAEVGNYEIAKLLVEKGADVNTISDNGETLLYVAAQNGHYNIVEFLTYDYSYNGIIKWIFGMVIDVNKAKHDGSTPLYAAAQNGHYNIVNLLVEKGADVNKAKHDGSTPLYVAAKYGRCNLVKLLVEKGADVNKALFVAAHKNQQELVKVLEEAVNPQEATSEINYPKKVIMEKHEVYKGSEKCDEFIVAVNFKEQQGGNKLIIKDFGLEDKINFSCYPGIKTVNDLNIESTRNSLRNEEKTIELTYSEEGTMTLKNMKLNDLGEDNFIFYNDKIDNLHILESICSNTIGYSD